MPAQEEAEDNPQPQQEQNESQQEAPADQEQEQQQSEEIDEMDDVVLAATQAILSKQILEQLKASAANNNSRKPSGRSNMHKYSDLRGRPVGVRKGNPGNGARLNVIETLRAAAPWQRLRQQTISTNDPRRIVVEKEDFRIGRFKQRTVTTTIFVVDASGSAALHRLAEAKGAVEMLLSECYQRRDQVSLIAFRGKTAELVLPPTRSLVRAKRCLAGLPGGGATPLAAGIDAAVNLAEQIKSRGEMPSVVLLTDGRANITRDGKADRPTAESESINAAQQIRLLQIGAILIDTSPRAQAFNQQVAAAMDANYLALPHADAATMSNAILKQSTTSETKTNLMRSSA